MDFLFIGLAALLGAITVLMVIGLSCLDQPAGTKK